MSTEGPDPSVAPPGRRRLPRLLLGATLATAVLAGGTALALAGGGASGASNERPAAVRAPVVVPTASLVGLAAGRVPWSEPLRLTVTPAGLTSVRVVGPDGAALAGTLSTGGWTSSSTLLPAATYRATATVRDSAAVLHRVALRAVTAPAEHLVKAALSPGDDSVVGVGRPVQVTLDRAVTDPAARAAVVARLSVRATPTVTGAWRWMDDRTLHYRPASFWRTGTKVRVQVDLQRLALPDGAWGSGARTTAFTVGEALISTVDVGAHTMTVRRNGKVLRVLRASMGRPQFPTRNGTFLVLEKQRKRVMDSATVNLPPGTPAYRTEVEHAVRITNSGTFTHGAPWSVKDQGVRNVSHGCINLSPTDAAWYFDLARRGDVVQVVGSTRGPSPYDAGSRDWNMSFTDWKKAA